jgi:hypothetical protein
MAQEGVKDGSCLVGWPLPDVVLQFHSRTSPSSHHTNLSRGVPMDADFNRHASAYARNAPPRVGLRLGAFSNPEHKSSFAKLHDSDPGRGMRKVFMCIMVRAFAPHVQPKP